MSITWAEYLTKGVGPTRPALIGGNWKCNGTKKEIAEIINNLNSAGHFPQTSEVVIAAPALHICSIQSKIRADISIAAEDVGFYGMGAYTGEHSAAMLVDAGVKWTLVGHSERRNGFGQIGEGSELIAQKASNSLQCGMSVILCIGEHLPDREAGKALDVCIEMLTPCVNLIQEDEWKKVVIAYEPCWAIGTGRVASPEQAEETHKQIRGWLSTTVSPYVAAQIRIIYGGSVNAKNCGNLIVCPNIDGFLVGGASLKKEFADIIKCTE